MLINTRTLLTYTKGLGLLAFSLLLSLPLFAQRPGGGSPGGGFNREAMNIGRFYGKVVDETGKGVGFATVQLYGMRFDTTTKQRKETLISGQITEDNGDFNLEKLPVMGKFTLKVSFLGYAEVEQEVTFGLTRESMGGDRSSGGGGRPGGGFAGMGGANFDVDLGNISLTAESSTLETVTVTGEINELTLALDRKIYRVDKNANATGGTAEDALRNVPSLSIDLDGNLTLRNASPQLFVDGRPTNMTLDQIPADAIETVEVITNPSAKYDASGGQAGIVNIVLKKERRIGYHGGIRAGFDSQGGINAGGDINAREGKFNLGVSGFYGNRKHTGQRETDRQNLFGSPLTNLLQKTDDKSDGFFARGQVDLDWFMDNRNTITFRGSYLRGQFGGDGTINIHTDSLFSNRTTFSDALRTTDSERNFRRIGYAVLYKHLFPKKGKELTADLNYGSMEMDNLSNYNTQYLGTVLESREQQDGGGGSDFYTFQVDFVNPLTDKLKFEAGARAMIRNFENNNSTAVFDFGNDLWIPVNNYADKYNFEDAVYAGYAIMSYQFDKWGFQAGLRGESSTYTGTLPDEGLTFENNYPISLFPSFFVTHNFSEAENMQLSYSRRVNRPHFFQLMPFTDFSDSLNLRRGNPDLLPEFTNSLELSYQKIFEKGHNLLVSAYYKSADDLITAYQFTENIPELDQEVIISTYRNSSSSQAYGMEFTLRNTLFKGAELSTNVNIYNSRVDASNIETNLIDNRVTWFLKENFTLRLPANFTLQLSGQYRSRASFSPESSSGRRRGHRGGNTSTAQGYTIANWFVDAAIRKDLFKRKVNLTVSMNDIFRTRKSGTYSESPFFIQETWRIRAPQMLRVNLSYRFGKADTSLFKRKNTNQNSEGMDMMGN